VDLRVEARPPAVKTENSETSKTKHFLTPSFKKNDPKFEKTWDHRIPVWNGSYYSERGYYITTLYYSEWATKVVVRPPSL
jgi:hypothetical protein